MKILVSVYDSVSNLYSAPILEVNESLRFVISDLVQIKTLRLMRVPLILNCV